MTRGFCVDGKVLWSWPAVTRAHSMTERLTSRLTRKIHGTDVNRDAVNVTATSLIEVNDGARRAQDRIS